MVTIKPFRAYHFNREKVGTFEQVITPPYDVISPEAEKRFYEKSPYNFARLDLPKAQGAVNKYERAAQILQEWIRDNILVQDPEPAIYVYSHTFPRDDNVAIEVIRSGFVSLLDLAPGDDVFAHEQTLQKPFEDRLRLMETTRAYFGLIFQLYDDKERIIDHLLETQISGRAPLVKFKDDDDVIHRIWAVTDAASIKRVTKEMAKYTCVIADGHHRFKVARQYYKDCVEQKRDPESARWPMICFVNSFNEGLNIRPTNRLVFNIDVPTDLVTRLQQKFDVTEEKDITTAIHNVRTTQVMVDEATNLKNHVFAMVDNPHHKGYFLSLRDPTALKSEHSDVYTKIDVNVLHSLIFQDILGISSEDQAKGSKVAYVKGDEDTLAHLQREPAKYQLGFFINPPLMREVFITARSGETMPQKSTYFYPKLYSGLIIHKLPDLVSKGTSAALEKNALKKSKK